MNPGIEFLKRFFTFRAFTPDPQNPNIPLLKRLGKEKIALMSIGPCGLKMGSFTKNGGIQDIEVFPMRLQDDTQDIPIVSALVKKTDCGLVALTTGWKFGLAVETNKFKNEVELNIELGSTPANVLGQKFQPDKRYMGLITPDEKQSVIMDVEEDAIQNIEDMLATYNIKVIRAQVGLASMLKLYFSNPELIPDDEKTVPLLHDNGNVLAILKNNGRTTIRLFAGVVDPRPDNAPVERATKLTERLTEILKNQRAGIPTEFAVMDSGLPKLEVVMAGFVASSQATIKNLSWRPVEVPSGAFEFEGLLIN